jgi:hypothetical protein
MGGRNVTVIMRRKQTLEAISTVGLDAEAVLKVDALAQVC